MFCWASNAATIEPTSSLSFPDRSGHVTRLTVVAHSQGTIIALHTLYLEWTRERLKASGVRLDGLPKLQLVTLGSPFTHLYQHYFPRRYPPLFDDPHAVTAFNEEGWFFLEETVGGWKNIYRVDDFVGTDIVGDAGNTFPRNQPIHAGGHIDYWSDRDALVEMLPLLPGPDPGAAG